MSYNDFYDATEEEEDELLNYPSSLSAGFPRTRKSEIVIKEKQTNWENDKEEQYNVSSEMREEIECMKDLCECLKDCITNIKGFLNQLSREVPTGSIQQALECFQYAITLLSGDPEPSRIKALVFANKGELEDMGLVTLILDFIALPSLPTSNQGNATGKNNNKNKEFEKLFNHLKIYSVNCLSKFISICSYESKNRYDQIAEEHDLRTLAKTCAETIAQEHGLDILFEQLLSNRIDSVDLNVKEVNTGDFRVAVAECLFFFVTRNEFGRLALMIQKGLNYIMKCMEKEVNPLIRSYCCAILREFSSTYPDELLKDNLVQNCCKYLNSDPSPEVRAICAEVLEVLIRTEPKSFDFISIPSVCKIINDRLTKETAKEVIEASCKLLETLFSVGTEVQREFISKSYWKSIIRVLKQCSVRPASLALRSLRILLQSAPYEEKFASVIANNFQSLSVLLKSALEQNKPSKKKGKNTDTTSIAHKLLKVELSIVLSLLFIHSSNAREHVRSELATYPLWMSTLRGALLKHLSYAEIEYFADVKIVDERGVDIYALFKTNNSGYELTSSSTRVLQEIFEDQEREEEYSLNNFYSSSDEEDEKAVGRVISFILSFSIYSTLSPEEESKKEVEELSNDDSNIQISVHQVTINSPFKNMKDKSPKEVERLENVTVSNNSESSSIEDKYENNGLLNDDKDSIISAPAHVLTPSKERKHFLDEIDEFERKSVDGVILTHKTSTEFNGRLTNTTLSEDRPDLFGQMVNVSPQPSSPLINNKSTECFTPTSAKYTGIRKTLNTTKSDALTIQKRNFENTVYLCKKFGVWYESKEMRIKKQKAQENFVKAHRLAAIVTGTNAMPTGYISAQEGLMLRYRPNLSPQKLTKSWCDEDIKLAEVFTFEIPFDDFSIDRIERVLGSLSKHSKYIKKCLVICPQGQNAKGRRTFLLDLNQNILPKTQSILEQLLQLIKEYGMENIKMPIYLWKGKERRDASLTQYNILEVLEFVKVHLANYYQGSNFERSIKLSRETKSGKNSINEISDINESLEESSSTHKSQGCN